MIWNPNPIAFEIFGLDISWYGISWSLAIVIGYLLMHYIFNKEQRDTQKLVLYIQYIFIGSLLGARLFEMIFYDWENFISNPLLFFNIRNGGLASHGAMLGSIIAILLFIRRNKEFSFQWSLDRLVIVVLAQGAVIRLGNFVNSELYGRITEVPWGIQFMKIDNLYRHPVQLYEFAWLSFCCILFFVIYHHLRKQIPYLYTSLFLVIALGGRVLIEFYKEAEPLVGIFSKTQIISLVSIGIGIILYYNKIYNNQNQ